MASENPPTENLKIRNTFNPRIFTTNYNLLFPLSVRPFLALDPDPGLYPALNFAGTWIQIQTAQFRIIHGNTT